MKLNVVSIKVVVISRDLRASAASKKFVAMKTTLRLEIENL